MSKKLILIHGSGGNGANHWFPYVQSVFEDRGWEVFAPNLPDADAPDRELWVDTIKKITAVTSETVLVGHSLGCPCIMTLLEQSEVCIDRAVCVAGLYNNTRFNHSFLQNQYDWLTIREHCKSFVFVHSNNDPWDCDEKEADFVFTKLSGTKVILDGKGHFGSTKFNQPFTTFPLLTSLISNEL